MEEWSVLLASATSRTNTLRHLTLNKSARRVRGVDRGDSRRCGECGIVAASDGERTPDGNPDGPPRPCPRRDGDAHGP